VWPVHTIVPIDNAYAIRVSEQIATLTDVSWSVNIGYRRKFEVLDELTRLVGSITSVPFV